MSTAYERKSNIVKKAVEIGFKIESVKSSESLAEAAEQFLIDNTKDPIEIEGKLGRVGGNQSFEWSDGKGFNYDAQGELISFQQYKRAQDLEKIYHTTLVDSDGNVIKFYEVNVR
jgi:hypothetical protein